MKAVSYFRVHNTRLLYLTEGDAKTIDCEKKGTTDTEILDIARTDREKTG